MEKHRKKFFKPQSVTHLDKNNDVFYGFRDSDNFGIKAGNRRGILIDFEWSIWQLLAIASRNLDLKH